jgi:hypothetical protein
MRRKSRRRIISHIGGKMQYGPFNINGRTLGVRSALARFCKDRSGNFAILLAAGALPLFLAAGAAVDYAVNQNSATKLQDILDAAVLAGAEHNGSDSEKRKAANKYFKALIANQGGYVADAKAKFKIEDSSVISGSAKAETPLFITGVFLKGPMQLGVESAAVYAKKLKSVKFQATDAQGWWEKTVRLMVIRKGSSTPEEIANVHYAVSAAKPPSKGTIKANPSGVVDLGDYEKAYMEMTIGPTAYEFDKWCAGCPTVLRSDDPATSDRFTIDGKTVAKGTVLNIFDFAKCDETSNQAWEDGGGGLPDISYKLTGYCGTDSTTVRLIK